jgi:Na+/proline symporter
VFAAFIVEELPAGVRGLVIGAVFAAAMSTLSSSLNSSATALVNDLLPRKWLPGDAGRLRATRLFTVVFGAAQVAVGIGGRWLTSSVVASVLAIAGFTTGIILGVFLLGAFTTRTGPRAALAGLIVGLALLTGLSAGTALAWPWFALVGAAATFAVGIAAAALGIDR